jgi:hypothetical protein
VSEPAPGSGQETIIDLDRRELLSILRSIQDADAPTVVADSAPEQQIPWLD